MRVQAVFWDMDGTIVDTEPYWFRAQLQLAARYGFEWDEERATAQIGSALPATAAVLQRAGVAMPVEEIIEWLTQAVLEQLSGELIWRPGARELLAALRQAEIPCVLVTMSRASLAAEVVKHLPSGTFEFLVTGEMVVNGKPHPEPYLLAAELLRPTVPELELGQVVAFEDSLPGTASAHAAGLVTVGVPNLVPLPVVLGVTLWPTLSGCGVAELEELIVTSSHAVVPGG